MDSDEPPASTVSGLVATLIPTLIVALIYVFIFLYLRSRQPRWYSPRSYLGTMREQNRSPPLPGGFFNWIAPFWKIPDEYALQHQSLDAYLFLRFLRMTVVIMFVGCCITWPVLFPINATGGAASTQLDILSMSNVDRSTSGGKYKYFAHAIIGWIFFGFILALVTRETIFYINLRQAYLLSPAASGRISSRTVLFTSVPTNYLDEAKLRRVFGRSVRNVWITANTKNVDELVEERDKVAFKLEAAEVKLIKAANGERIKAIKKGAVNEVEPIGQGEAESGSVAARWIPQKSRPTHKLGKFGLYGKKVDSINWARMELERLIPETMTAQDAYKAGESPLVGAVFIQFNHQSEAQAAYQILAHHQALQMSPRYIGVNPNEIVWKSLQISWWQKVVRRFAVQAFIAAMIIFWAIPVAFVGLISNINYLQNQYSWLHWLSKIPTVIMGVVTGLLPSVMLSILMSLVPIIMRLCAKISGEPTLSRVELFTQNAYFAFQVIQVFLVATVGSSASSLIAQLQGGSGGVQHILDILSQRIPTASNLYISYFLVQGLTISAGVISQVVGFFIFKILYKLLAKTPRKMYQKWSALSAISWGSTLPVFTNIAVIGIVYSCIAPLVLGFATIAMSFFYLAYRYNILFVSDSQIDTQGLIYPRALQHLLCGVYIAEVCLIAMFAINTTYGPLVLMIAFLIFTALYHISLNAACDPLLYNLPKTLEAEEESIRGQLEAGLSNSPGTAEKKGSQETRDGKIELVSGPHKKPNFLAKFLKPHIYSDYATLRNMMPMDANLDIDNMYPDNIETNAYYPPTVVSEPPLLWIPRDEGGISAQEVRHTSKVIPITDEGCIVDGNNKIIWEPEASRPPLWSEKVNY